MKTWSPLRVVGLVFLLYQTAEAAAATRCPTAVATLVSLQGDVAVRGDGDAAWQSPVLGDPLCPGDTVRVGRASRAGLAVGEHTLIRLDADSVLVLPPARTSGGFWVRLQQGLAHLISRISTQLTVRTAFANAGVEGTEFLVHAEQTQAVLDVIEGRVAFENEKGIVRVHSGERAIALEGQAPTLTIPVRPTDAVQWAMHFPNLAARTRAPPWLVKAQQALVSGERNAAINALNQATSAAADQADVQAMLAIIAVVDNRTQVALDHAKSAVQLAPKNPRALLSLSYAYQANGQLSAATDAATAAVADAPDDPVLLARQAEMQLADDDPATAAKTAARATELAPDYSRPYALRGFAVLAEGHDAVASEAFDQAIARDSADPLPRIGRALTLIRTGDLAAGRHQLEIAVSLAPGSAVVRAYLGKAYAAENRDKRAAEQYEIARQLDPLDPTAYFYEAILLTTQNRPIEALQLLETAAENNPNRRVYRSSLAADSDQAARQAAIARVYQSLGFDGLAEEAAAEALARDPADPAAHRFRADVLSADRRQGVAKASETLQAQLLQPLNLYPVPPTLGVSNINILRDAGPSISGVNEYHSLLRRDGGLFQATVLGGNNDTFGDEVLAGIVQGPWALHATQFHYQTEGFRPNADNREDITSVFVQHQISGQTSIQAEVRRHDQKLGDIGLDFSPDAYSADQRREAKNDTARVGLRYHMDAATTWLGSLIYASKRVSARSTQKPIPSVVVDTTQDARTEGVNAETQLLKRWERTRLVSGVGYYENQVATTDASVVTIGSGSPIVTPPENEKYTESHVNGYAYFVHKLRPDMEWEFGLSADRLRSSSLHASQLNPKFGVRWQPTTDTAIRASAFRTLQRSLASGQTIEPTTVGGFTQLVDDPLGTDARNVGVSITSRLTDMTWTGAQGVYRELRVPSIQDDKSVLIRDHSELRLNGFLAAAVSERTSLEISYEFERLRRSQTNNLVVDRPLDLQTHTAPITLTFHNPRGLYYSLVGTHVYQRGKTVADTSGATAIQSDQFWLADVAAGYRLPKRQGALVLRVTNLFDRSFRYRDTDFATGGIQAPTISPERAISMSIALQFD